ncbi:SCP2 sterol-binding domain-containing protein [Thermodesulfovibrionales bacterium]|nr:SCP2 sterol-binding domain-containing protein [Thermodesulfovibrionales bacterium]
MSFQAIVAKVKEKVAEKKVEGTSVYQFCLSGDSGGDFSIAIGDGQIEVKEGLSESSNLTVNISDADLISLMEGQLNPTNAFLAGKIKVKGDMSLAMKLQSLLG